MRYQRIHLRLRQPLPVQGGMSTERIVLRLEENQRSVDCAPLPGLHKESLDDCERCLQAGARTDLEGLPSLRTALALLRCPVPEPKLPMSPCRGSRLLSLPDPPDAQVFWENWDPHFQVFKIKIGRHDPGFEAEILQEIQRRVPNAELRLDANRALDLLAFKALAKNLRDLPIRYFEEPCQDPKVLLRLCADYPIALDESLSEGPSPELLAAAAAWVIKPNRLGWTESLAFFEAGNRSGKAIVLSNAFESRPMLQTYAWFYAQLVHKPEALGFGTAAYFAEPDAEWDPLQASGPWPVRPFPEPRL